MSDKGFILQSSYGSVFSVVEDLEEKVVEQNNEKLVTIAGRVNNPGTIEIPENSTLSDEDCIITFAKFYVEFLIAKVKNSEYEQYFQVENEIERIWRILDRISKGKATMRDVYLLRYLSDIIKTKLNQRHNLILESIEQFYDEIEEHQKDLPQNNTKDSGHCFSPCSSPILRSSGSRASITGR